MSAGENQLILLHQLPLFGFVSCFGNILIIFGQVLSLLGDTPIRFLGYANEVGEAFRALTPLWFVRATYGVASAYVLADTYDKTSKMKMKPESTTEAVAFAAVDTLVWQAFASVLVPGFTINRVCAASLLLLAKGLPKVPIKTRKWATTIIGLGCIPFIVHPIDNLVHTTMNLSIRKFYIVAPVADNK